MFFAPPKVKSLSRYAEFGVYLGHKDFLIMLSIAVFMHMVIIGIYAMSPRQEVVHVPVRVLNIKLTGGKESVEMPAPDVAAPAPAPAVLPMPMELPVTKPQQAVRHETHNEPPPPPPVHKAVTPKRTVTDDHMRPQRHVEHASAPVTSPSSPSLSMETPKKYVREGDLAAEAAQMQAQKMGAASGTGNGTAPASSAMGKTDGETAAARYEQVISAWIQRHRVYPAAALQQGLEGNAIVRIRIDRMGHVLYRAIDQSSGNAVIDDAVLGMVNESSPLPPVPQDYPEGSQLEFLVPVTFRLR